MSLFLTFQKQFQAYSTHFLLLNARITFSQVLTNNFQILFENIICDQRVSAIWFTQLVHMDCASSNRLYQPLCKMNEFYYYPELPIFICN